MGDLRPGAALHAIDLLLPLPLMQSGLLRIWPSRAHYGADSLSVAFQGPQLTADGVVVKVPCFCRAPTCLLASGLGSWL